MYSCESILLKLQENDQDVFNEVVRLLIKIADNILKNPSDPRVRSLQKSNVTISKKVLCVKGGEESLKFMGFEECDSSYVLPSNCSLEHLRTFRDRIKTITYGAQVVSEKGTSSNDVLQETNGNSVSRENATNLKGEDRVIKKIVLPPFTSIFSNQFLKRIERYFHEMLAFEDKDLLERAKSLIPLPGMEETAQGKLRRVQEQIKKGKLNDPELSIQDMLILELLSWFKNDFFTWVDSPDCSNCGGKTRMSHMSKDPNLLVYTDRVEMHICDNCQQYTSFPRYNDLNILLETRRGRCGEWAKVFTLMCRSLGWDSRFVVDEGDHVWTEVYSVTQKRWLHCDSCENTCDTPLVYESGWGKKLSYVIAYSAEEVQDVTWRYSSNHKEVLKRRKNCSETELIDALIKLRENRQKSLSEMRRKYLTKRLLLELVELMVEKKPNDSDKQGRISGSSAWRLARGEIQENHESAVHIWTIKENETLGNCYQVSYSPSLDRYKVTLDEKTIATLDGWHSGTFNHSDMFRKEEKDWKMVYLSRTESSNVGSMSWKFSIDAKANRVVDKVNVILKYKTFENGEVDVQVAGDGVNLTFDKGQESMNTCSFSGSKSLTVTAKVKGGKGDVAWQHAQLFRQSLESDDHPFCIKLTFKNS